MLNSKEKTTNTELLGRRNEQGGKREKNSPINIGRKQKKCEFQIKSEEIVFYFRFFLSLSVCFNFCFCV